MWDATCPDTFAPSYSSRATNEAGDVATQAKERKEAKYTHLNSAHIFTQVAIETSGVFGVKTMRFYAGAWTAAGASHGGGEIHQLPYSEAFGGSATW